MELLRLFSYVFALCIVMCDTVRGGGSCSKLENTLSDKLLDMLVAIRSGRKTGHAGGDVIGEKRPAFSMTLAKHPVTLSGVGTILKFDHVILNRGNSYSTTTGQFTVPLDGLYQFSATIMSVNGGQVHTGIYRNGKMVMLMYGAKINGGSETANPVIELTKGDTIDVRHYSSASENVHGGHWSHMSGFYIGQ